MAEAAQTCVTVHNLNLFPNYDVSKHGEEGEDSGHCRFSVNDEEGDMIYFETIREVVHSRASFICMGDDDDFMASVDEFLVRN